MTCSRSSVELVTRFGSRSSWRGWLCIFKPRWTIVPFVLDVAGLGARVLRMDPGVPPGNRPSQTEAGISGRSLFRFGLHSALYLNLK